MKTAAAFLMLCAAVTLRAGDAPPTILSVALAAAEKIAIPWLPKEDNLTSQSMQLEQIAALLARAGRIERALRLIEGLETEARVLPPSYVPLAVEAIRTGDAERSCELVERLSSLDEWTTPGALADIALAMYAAGDERGAIQLAQQIDGGAEQYRALIGMKRFTEALPAAAAVQPSQFHDISPEGHVWMSDYDGSLSALLALVTVFVDQGDLLSAHKALDAMAEIADEDIHAFRARALLEIARREEAVPTLRKALEEVELMWDERPGQRRDEAILLARIAESLAAAGEPSLAVPLLPKAVSALGPTDSVEKLEIAVTIACEALARIARAHFALGEPKQALALLDRAAHLADTLPVPRTRTKGYPIDEPSSARQDKVETLARVAVELELAGETRKAAEVLGRARAELDAIPSAEWREYAWKAIADVYADAGRIDRALDILVSGKSADPDKFFALYTHVTDDVLYAASRERRWALFRVMPPTWSKIELEARLASRLDREGDTAEARLLVADALASVGTKDWTWNLMRLATLAPGADQPGDAQQQRILRRLLAKLPR